MDFFEQQQVAKKNTTKLVVLMIVGVVCVIVLTYPAVWFALVFGGGYGTVTQPNGEEVVQLSFFEPELMLLTMVGVGAVVVFGSLYKLAELRAGGRVIAEHLGGKLISPNTRDPAERKMLNVVEEMAIASGVPVPPVYLMQNETAINAFAAGYSPDDAVIGVTRGSIDRLSRDELQGVIAHEFSHILNGDMKRNIRLIGIVHGILVIGLLGWMLIRIGFYSSATRSRNNKQNAGAAFGIAGIGLVIIGFVGVLFGNLIKAAVSRQREYLADAASVQFTRNPTGISGALQKIGGLQSHGKLQSEHADEASHMFFAQGVTSMLGGLTSTHPPLPKRIQRIDPNWDGVFPSAEQMPKDRPSEEARHQQLQEEERQRREKAMGILTGGAVLAGGAAAGQTTGTMAERIRAVREAARRQHTQTETTSPTQASDSIGNTSEEHIAYAQLLLDSVPEPIRQAAREPFGARAVVYLLLLDRSDTFIRDAQWQQLEQQAEPGVLDELKKLQTHADDVDEAAQLPLLDLAIGALRHLSPKQYEQFRTNVSRLIEADRQTSLFEWTLQRVLLRHLEPTFAGRRKQQVHYYNLKGVAGPLSVLLSTLVYAGHKESDQAKSAFEKANAKLDVDLTMADSSQCGLRVLGEALDQLELVAMRCKKQIIQAATAAIASDHEVTLKEAELLRAISDSLDCPMPPILPGQDLS